MKLEESINHREFAAAGTMHPTMAKFMKPGEHMDYYEPKNGDKVSGKVVKNNGKVVHVRHASGEMHKFDVSTNPPKSVDESEGLEGQGVAEGYSTYQGKGNHRPGWMLRADPELKAKFDAIKKKQEEKSKILGSSNLKPKKESTEIMDESKDTKEIDPKTGKVKSWKHEGDWKKPDKKNPIGKIYQMSDTARRKTAAMAKQNESSESWRKSEEDRIEREARKKAGHKDSATVDKIRAMMAAEKIKKSTMKEGYEPFSFKQFNDAINEGDWKKGEWKKETPWEKIPKDEKDEFGNVIKTKNIAKNLAKKARKQSEKYKSSPMENVHENELEEGWADMKKASTEFKKSIMSDLDKKNTKFTRFNKKETSTGTEYTRKPETFSDENDEASEKKSDKMKQAASGEKQEKRRRGRPAGSYGGSYKARSAEGKAASAAKAAATKAANRKIRGESLDDQYVIDLFRGLEEQTDRDDFYDLLGCDEFKCLTLEENTLLEEQFIAYENLSESQLDDIILEELSKDSTAGKWIKDFIKSENPRFDDKSRAKRKEMALAAYYAKQGE